MGTRHLRPLATGALALAIALATPAAAFARTVVDVRSEATACAYPADTVHQARERAEATLSRAHAEARGRIEAGLAVEARASTRAMLLDAQTALDAQLRQSLDLTAAIEARTREGWERTVGLIPPSAIPASACAAIQAKVVADAGATLEAVARFGARSLSATADAVLRLAAATGIELPPPPPPRVDAGAEVRTDASIPFPQLGARAGLRVAAGE